MLGANTWTLDWLTLSPYRRDRDSAGVQWILTEEKGFWGSPGPEANVSPRLNRHGVYRAPGWKKQRTITLTFRAYAPDFTTLRRAEADVGGILDDANAPTALTCFTEIGAITTDVYLDDAILAAPLDVISEPGIEFSIQLMAPDPRKYSVEWETVTTSLPSDTAAADGLDFSFAGTGGSGLQYGDTTEDGLIFGTTNASGFMQLRNEGTAPTDPVYTLTGPLTNPTLAAGSAAMTYNGALADGETVVIDTQAPSVLLGGTASRRQLLNPAQFSGFTVPPATRTGEGVLAVGLTHTGPVTATGYVQAQYRSAWF